MSAKALRFLAQSSTNIALLSQSALRFLSLLLILISGSLPIFSDGSCAVDNLANFLFTFSLHTEYVKRESSVIA